MSLSMDVKRLIAIAAVVVLPACSSSSDDSDNDAPVVADNPTTVVDDEPDDTGTDTETETPVGGDTLTALFGPAQYLVSECGSLPVSTIAVNNSLDAPAQFNVGEVVQGQVVPNSTDSNFHVWQVSIEPGNYHLVVDAWTVDDEAGLIGLEIDSLGATSSEDERLVYETENGYDLRIYEYVEIQAATTLTLKIESVYDEIQNYTLGFIPNGTAVPSPSFTRCLPITALSTGTTQSFTAVESETRADQLWYRMDLLKEEYVLEASASSATKGLIGLEFEILAPFGDSEKRITYGTTNDFVLTTSDTFEPDVAGPAWIRFNNIYNTEPAVEFTVTAP